MPELVVALGLVVFLVVGELVEEPGFSAFAEVVHEFPGSEALEGLENAAEVGGGGEEVQVVVHEYVGMEAEGFFLAAVSEGVGEDLAFVGAVEGGDPFDDGGGEEVGGVGVVDFVAGAHGVGG